MSICLCMIVKNESKVITRCLSSIKDLVDYWIIVDTGSTDGTQDIIKEYMKDIPGELHESPWRGFNINRTESLQLARDKADYTWVIDADEVIVRDSTFQMNELVHDSYLLKTVYGILSYYRKQIVSNKYDWRYDGVLHEYIITDEETNTAIVKHGLYNMPRHDGSRSSDPHKYQKDALILEAELLEHPDDSRTTYYLAQSYRDANNFEAAIRCYKKRAEMGGWEEEVFSAWLNIGKFKDRQGMDWADLSQDYLKAYEVSPHRSEPLYYLARGCRLRERYHEAYLWSSQGIGLPYPPKDILFVESAIYEYGMLDEFATIAFHSDHFHKCHRACDKLLNDAHIPVEHVERVLKNMDVAAARIREGK